MSDIVSETLPTAPSAQEANTHPAGSSAPQAEPIPSTDDDSVSSGMETAPLVGPTEGLADCENEDEASVSSTLDSLKSSLTELNLPGILAMLPDQPRLFKTKSQKPCKKPAPAHPEYLDITTLPVMGFAPIMSTSLWPHPFTAPYYPHWPAYPAVTPQMQTEAIARARRAGQDLEQRMTKRAVIDRLAGTDVSPAGQLEGRRVILVGLEPEITSAQVLDCFRVCGQIELVSRMNDSQLQGVSHIAVVFASETGAQNAVHLASLAQFSSLGGRVFAEITEGPFTVAGRTLELDFGVKIPFDSRAREGMRTTFRHPMKLFQEGHIVRMLFKSPEEAQAAFIKAEKMKITASLM